VTLDDLIAEIGVDVARWYLLGRSHDTAIDLDLDQARDESRENPVHYVRYAHARIQSIFREANGWTASAEGTHPLHPSERELVKRLLVFGAETAEAADRRAPHRVAAYSLEVAQAFTAFYRDCRVLGVPEQHFRLALCLATRTVIARSLDLLGIEAPETM
jgi:arginyl-tRNA synthetase